MFLSSLSACRNKLSILNLNGAKITNDSLTHIIENLQPTLEKLDASWWNDITELKSMPKLRVLTCDQITYHEKQNLKKSFGEIW